MCSETRPNAKPETVSLHAKKSMKHLIIGILFLIYFPMCFGSTYGVVVGQINNIYYEGIYKGETRFQNQAIAYLCYNFIADNYPEFSEKVFLEIQMYNGNSNGISWEGFHGTNWIGDVDRKPTKDFGLRIRVSKSENRAALTLKLLQFGIINLDSLKKMSNEYHQTEEELRPDELNISPDYLAFIINSPINKKAKATLTTKVFRNLGKEESEVNREYYFQNDKYHFVDFLNKDSVYLTLTNIYQIISDYYLGTLVLDTDSTGYFYNRETRKLSEKFLINNKKESFYFEKTSVDRNKKRIYFEYRSYDNKTMKFIYLTNDLILIHGFENKEDQIIKEILRNGTKG